MINTKKKFVLKKSELGNKFRVENNNLDLSSIIEKNEFEVVKLKEIASYKRENRNTSTSKNVTFKYVQISDIDTNLGIIKSCTLYKGTDAPKNAKRIMKKDDILISTRRPTRGAIVTVSDIFDGEICSIFFTVLQILDKSRVNPYYLSLFLRTSFCRYQFESMITETAYPVISDDDVLEMFVLLPSLPDQERIASMYQNSINKFNNSLNTAYKELIISKQYLENFILKSESEKLTIPTFGLKIFDANGEEMTIKDFKKELHYFNKNSKKQRNLDAFL